jgi:hypothetical protein
MTEIKASVTGSGAALDAAMLEGATLEAGAVLEGAVLEGAALDAGAAVHPAKRPVISISAISKAVVFLICILLFLYQYFCFVTQV